MAEATGLGILDISSTEAKVLIITVEYGIASSFVIIYVIDFGPSVEPGWSSSSVRTIDCDYSASRTHGTTSLVFAQPLSRTRVHASLERHCDVCKLLSTKGHSVHGETRER